MKTLITVLLCLWALPTLAKGTADTTTNDKGVTMDAQLIYAYILGTADAQVSLTQVDVNGDGAVNTLDVVAVYAAINAQPPQTGKSVVFVEGVSREQGWYDVNKVGKGENGDINMCWAASAANIIEWWQDRYVSKGGALPEGAIRGPGEVYELALMDATARQDMSVTTPTEAR